MKPKLYLASASPRRRQLLERLGLEFETIVSQAQEELTPGESPEAYTRRLAGSKAADIIQNITEGYVLAADTVVVVDNEIMGKPADDAEAQAMLAKLAGRWHSVVTGVALARKGVNGVEWRIDSEETQVEFYQMTKKQIRRYVATGEPLDKAGAYAIQGLGGVFVGGIRGDYSNVVGLPCALCLRLLQELGYPVS